MWAYGNMKWKFIFLSASIKGSSVLQKKTVEKKNYASIMSNFSITLGIQNNYEISHLTIPFMSLF